MSASMWRILKKQDVMSYWKVSEFVSFVMETVPELVLLKHWTQLNLGLRARFIFELFRRGEDHELIQSHLEKIKPQQSTQQGEMSEEEKAAINFLELIHALLKDDQERQDFIQEVYPKEYGPQYDSDLQMLLWEFLCRLDQLLPVPELEQTVSWLGESSGLEDFTECVSKPTHMKNLLQHHKQLGHLEQHVPPSSMGDHILSSLTAALQNRPTKHEEQCNLECPSEDPQPVTFVEDVAMEIITVTEYAEVELSANTDIEVLIEDTTHNSTMAEDGMVVVLSENVSKDMQESEVTEEKLLNGSSNTEIIKEDSQVTQHKPTSGPHDCPDCDKKFKFASSLIAHRVIHTGERPHKCAECGRCFSFRQSLERHRNMHKIRKSYECAVCGESFLSVAARTVHKQMHMEHGVYSCQKCNKKFSQELALARHMKTHTDDNADKDIVESNGELEVISEAATPSEEQSKKTNCECNTSDTGVIDPQLMNEVISLVKVRTSGRKRKPTMKVQMTHLQKTNKRQKEAEKVKDAEMKPVPFASTEHSYGSSVACSKEDDEGPVAEGQHAAFSCPKCDYCHSEEAQVQQHINKTHSIKPDEETQATQPPPDVEGRFSCSDCDKTFRFHSLLKAHQRIHTGEQPYLCSQCGRRFSFRQSLERHRLTHKSGRKYECLICGEFFKSLVAQREHSGAHMENGEYVCTECGRTFAWKSALVRHLKTHSSEVEKGVFTCPHCELDFNCASSLNRHLQTHQEERVHVCNCGKSFAYKAALTAHQRVHQKDRPHVCGQCGKGFLYRGGLSSHQKIHSQEMPFMCSYCGKSFKRERNMKKHERCHTRENVFQCSQCDKGFVYKATLTRHELTHSGERPYLCADCGKGFFSHAELLKHERFHTGHKPFQCSHCGKRFTQSCYLTIHLRYHTGVKPYTCSECDKSFLSANRLKRHQRTHSGEKPYVCGECGKGFRQSYHLKMHQRTHAIKLM